MKIKGIGVQQQSFTHSILYVIQVSDMVFNVTFPAYDIYSLRRTMPQYILYLIAE
jgi:hypothetical protein